MNYKGSCHCGQISFEVEGSLEQAMECNCSHCNRKGYLLWFVPRPQFKLNTPEEDLVTYTFQQARHQASFFARHAAFIRLAKVPPHPGRKRRQSMSVALKVSICRH